MNRPVDATERIPGPTAVIGLILVIGALLLAAVGFAWQMRRLSAGNLLLVTQGPAFAQGWVERVRLGKFDEALTDGSAGFQSRMTPQLRQELIDLVHRLPANPPPGWTMSGGQLTFGIDFGKARPGFINRSPKMS